MQDGAGLEAGAGETDGASGAGDERSRIGGGESCTGEVEVDGGTSGQIWAALARHPANPRWSARVAARAPTMASSHIFVESLKSSKYSAILKDTEKTETGLPTLGWIPPTTSDEALHERLTNWIAYGEEECEQQQP